MQATTPEAEDGIDAAAPDGINEGAAGGVAQKSEGEPAGEEESTAEKEQRRVDQLFSSGTISLLFFHVYYPLHVSIDPRPYAIYRSNA